MCFQVNLAKFFRTSFFIEHLRWLPMAKLESNLWNQQNFSSSYFWLNSCKIILKCDIETTTCGSVHSYSFKSCSPTFKEWLVLWNYFLNDLNVKKTSLFITLIRTKKCDNLTSEGMWDTRSWRYASFLRYPLWRFN